MKCKVLLIGDVKGSYRSQNLVKLLMDRRHTVGLATRRYYCANSRGSSFVRRLLRKVVNAFAWSWFAAETLFKAAFSDVLFLLPMNNRSAVIACLAKLAFRKPLIVELYISAYDSARDRSRIEDERSLKAGYYRLLDRIMIEESDLLIHLSRAELEYIARLVGAQIDAEKTRILPLAVDPKGKASLEPADIFRVCWWGTFIPLHGLERIITAAEILAACDADLRFDLLGLPGSDAEVYGQMIVDRNLESFVVMHDDKSFANGKLEPFLLAQCDLALGVFGTSGKARRTIVNKIVDAFAMGLPVLTMDSPALSEFIDKDRDLFVCSNSPQDIARAILAIIDQPEERQRRAEMGYLRYRTTFTVEQYSNGIQEALNTALSPAAALEP